MKKTLVTKVKNEVFVGSTRKKILKEIQTRNCWKTRI